MARSAHEVVMYGIEVEAQRQRNAAIFLLRLIKNDEPRFRAAFGISDPDEAELSESTAYDQTVQLYDQTVDLLHDMVKPGYESELAGRFEEADEGNTGTPVGRLGWAEFVPFTANYEGVSSYRRTISEDGRRVLGEYFGILGGQTPDDIHQAAVQQSRQALTAADAWPAGLAE